MNARAADIHPLPTAAPVFEARAAVDKAWISAPPATTALGAQRLHDPTTPPPTPNSVAHQPRNCEGTGTSDDKTGQTGASKTWLIRRRQHHADRSIRSMRAHLIKASKGRALRQQAGYTTAILSLSRSTSALQYGRRPYTDWRSVIRHHAQGMVPGPQASDYASPIRIRIPDSRIVEIRSRVRSGAMA